MSLGVPLHTHASICGVRGVRLVKVLEPAETQFFDAPASVVAVPTPDGGFQTLDGEIAIAALKDRRVIGPGDVIRLREAASLVSVLYRRGAKTNTLFATERCNSLCLMCSQPPRDDDDSWRVNELLELIPLIDPDELQLGITGGEPTLLGNGLTAILEACRDHLPSTGLHILTNGRRFAERPWAEAWAGAGQDSATWAVPLYADVSEIHDEVVASPGAFDETLMGLCEMARLGARVEIRVVLHRLTVPRLKALAGFIYRRLPFVEHIAFMGLEPMGFAKRNREQLWIDPADYADELTSAVLHLADRGMTASVYNLSYCVLPRALWPFARQSISEWKNTFPERCTPCVVKEHCAGFFASAGEAWRSRSLFPLTYEDFAA